ncbi:MAG: ribonuclease D [Anaerolineae bacterium]
MSRSLNHLQPDHNILWVDTPKSFQQMLHALLKQPLVAVDTESDSLFSYFEKVCLIQFSVPQADYLLDPLAVDVSALDQFFASDTIQKVFHAAEYDFLSLKRDYGFSFNNLFDTMLAARILGWPKYGLASLLEEHFGVVLNKRFQRYNWGQRPLGKNALDYAHLDTHYLLPLRQIQLDALVRQNRLREAEESFERLTHVEPSAKVFNPNDFWRVKGARDLRPQQQAVLRELYILRDKIARHLNRPPFKVMTDKVLVELSRTQPRKESDLNRIKGLGRKFLFHNAQDVLNAVAAGQAAEPPSPSSNRNHHRPDNSTLARYESLRQWRNDLAAERGVEPDVIINNQTLMDIARYNPKSLRKLTQLGLLGDWQRETYGKALLTVLRAAPAG